MKTLVIGVGNLLLRDDGVGIHVVNMLKKRSPEVDVLDAALGSVELLEEMRGYDRVVIVDAIITGAEPGTVFMVNLHQQEEPPVITSSHGIDIFTTLRLGEELYRDMPSERIIIGIEAEDITSYSEECTPRVAQAVKKVVGIILDLL